MAYMDYRARLTHERREILLAFYDAHNNDDLIVVCYRIAPQRAELHNSFLLELMKSGRISEYIREIS